MTSLKTGTEGQSDSPGENTTGFDEQCIYSSSVKKREMNN